MTQGNCFVSSYDFGSVGRSENDKGKQRVKYSQKLKVWSDLNVYRTRDTLPFMLSKHDHIQCRIDSTTRLRRGFLFFFKITIIITI